MNEFLAQAYGTASEDQVKLAQAEMFAKLAADRGVDLSQMSDGDVADLFNTFQAKLAEEGAKEEEEEEKKKKEEKKAAAAQYEFARIKEAQEKVAEADYLGRVMAHAYTDEMKKIAGARELDMGDKLPGKPSGNVTAAQAEYAAKQKAHNAPTHVPTGDRTSYGKTNPGGGGEKGRLARLGDSIKGHAEGAADKAKQLGRRGVELAQKYPGRAAAIGGAALAAGAGAAYMAHKGNDGTKKKASAIDELAAEVAIYKVAEAGFDPSEAGELLDAALTLGVSDEGSKIASAASFEDAVHFRAFELLEAVGYPINW